MHVTICLRVITVKTEPWRSKVRLITDITTTALGKKEMAVLLQATRDEQP
jgi:hypothetical protein